MNDSKITFSYYLGEGNDVFSEYPKDTTLTLCCDGETSLPRLIYALKMFLEGCGYSSKSIEKIVFVEE